MSLPSIACKDCGHVNEAQRIYCHNCGTKLDRSHVIEQEKSREEPAAKKQRRVRKMMNPGSGGILPVLKTGLKVIGYAALTAAIIQIARPPEEVPEMPDGAVETPPLGILLEELTMASGGRQVAFSEADVNRYLKGTVRPSSKEGVAVFQRAFVNMKEGLLRITSQTAIQGYPLYAGASYRLKIEDGDLSAIPAGIHLGRLDIPEIAAKHTGPVLDVLLKSLWDSLKREKSSMGKIGSVEVLKGQILLRSKGEPPAAAASAAAATPVGAP